jgi:LPXTG-motif cell wall-anchored protein
MRAARNRRLMWTAGTIVSVGLALGWAAAAGAVAIPGEPTASECQIIAQQAVNKGVTFEAELAANGGGVCPTTTVANVLGATAKPAVVLAASVPAAGLPRTGSNTSGPLTIGSIALLIGGALLIINRRRPAPAVASVQTVPAVTRSLPPPLGIAPVLRSPFDPPSATPSSWGPPPGPPLLQP